MPKLSFISYLHKTFQDTLKAITNLFFYIPYFFSVEKMLLTLFKPYKNIQTKKEAPGFNLQDFEKRLGDNLVSRFMGFAVRSLILCVYIMVLGVFVILVPGLFVLRLLISPLTYIMYASKPDPEQVKNKAREVFMQQHALNQDDVAATQEWFEQTYSSTQKLPWWELSSLLKNPPLGRDLTAGYTPTLDRFSTDLSTKPAHFRHMVGRKKEVEQLEQVLSKSKEANVVLVGDEGVGRKTLVEALAHNFYSGQTNQVLVYKRVLELNMEQILAESTDFLKREETLAQLFQEAVDAQNIIIFIDNLDQYISSEPDHVNLSHTLEKFASLPSIQFIGITTPYLYQKYFFNNQAISSLFEKIDVTELTPEESLLILKDIAFDFEARYKVTITYDAIKTAVTQTHRLMANQPLPEKAVEILDEACVYVTQHQNTGAVTGHVINSLLEQKTHVPLEVTSSMKEKLLSLEIKLQEKIVFQSEAIHALSAALRKSFVITGLKNKPLASFLFLGPTGVGKTATAKAITEIFFDDIKNMIRFDMSQYQSKEDINKLIGDSATGEPGLLTEAIRKQRYGTLLLDELEKAHKDLLNIFLTILDEGYFTDGYGKKVDCNNLVIIATSNAGAQFIYDFIQRSPNDVGRLSNALIDQLVTEKTYSPEFLNRFDGVLVFKPLSKEAIVGVAQRMLVNLQRNILAAHGINVTFSEKFVTELIQSGYDPRFGARNMERVIRDKVEDVLATMILSGHIQKGESYSF